MRYFLVKRGDARVLKFSRLEELGIVSHGFTLKPWDFSRRSPDRWSHRREVTGILGMQPDRLVTLNQVHSAKVVKVDDVLPALVEGDALLTDKRGLVLAMRFADCVPIFIVDPVRRCIGIVHSGWRGTFKEVVKEAVRGMKEHFGSDAGEIVAVIGPSIGPCCYEVKMEGEFRLHTDYIVRRDERFYFDLWSMIEDQLLGSGLKPKNIESLHLCTACNTEMFFSYRKEGSAKRMEAYIMLV